MPESIRLFAMCKAMKWAHMPVPGGLFDQHPILLDQWSVIFSEISKARKRDEDKRKRESKRKK